MTAIESMKTRSTTMAEDAHALNMCSVHVLGKRMLVLDAGIQPGFFDHYLYVMISSLFLDISAGDRSKCCLRSGGRGDIQYLCWKIAIVFCIRT